MESYASNVRAKLENEHAHLTGDAVKFNVQNWLKRLDQASLERMRKEREIEDLEAQDATKDPKRWFKIFFRAHWTEALLYIAAGLVVGVLLTVVVFSIMASTTKTDKEENNVVEEELDEDMHSVEEEDVPTTIPSIVGAGTHDVRHSPEPPVSMGHTVVPEGSIEAI